MSDAIERLINAWFYEDPTEDWRIGISNDLIADAQEGMARVLSALHLSPEAAAGLADGSWVAVPREPSEEMAAMAILADLDLPPDIDPRRDALIGARTIYRAMIAASQQNGEK